MVTDILNIFKRVSLGEATEEDRKNLNELDTDSFYSYLGEFSGEDLDSTIEVQIESKVQEPFEDFVYENTTQTNYSQEDCFLRKRKEVFCESKNINQAKSFAKVLGLSRRFLKKQRVKS